MADVFQVVGAVTRLEVVGGPARTVTVVEQGPQGPVGPPGAAGSGTVHVQTAPAATWLIAHAYGRPPAVSVYDAAGDQIVPDVHATSTAVTLVFATPTAGTAVLT